MFEFVSHIPRNKSSKVDNQHLLILKCGASRPNCVLKVPCSQKFSVGISFPSFFVSVSMMAEASCIGCLTLAYICQ
jgi:hypothetical protein